MMKNLKLTLALLLSLLVSGLAAQQEQLMSKEEAEKKKEVLESMKESYILETLELNEAQRKEMETLMRAHKEEMKAMRTAMEAEKKALKEQYRALKEGEKIAEADAKKLVESAMAMKEKQMALERKYMEKYVDAISAQKVLEYRKAEKEFKKELLHMLKDDRKEHHMRERMKEMREHRMMRDNNRGRRTNMREGRDGDFPGEGGGIGND